jgi:hypothetical protein
MKPVTQTDWTAGSDRTAVALAAGAAARAFVRQPHIKSRLLVVFQRQDPQSCFRTRIRRPSTAPFQRRTVAHDRNTLAPKNKTGKGSLPICVTSAWLSDLVRRDSHSGCRRVWKTAAPRDGFVFHNHNTDHLTQRINVRGLFDMRADL